MGQCAKLKWNRRRLGLTQEEFAKKLDLSVGTIRRLEQDETVWSTIRSETADKIYACYENMSSWQPENATEILDHIEQPEQKEVVVMIDTSKITDNDKKTLTLIEFFYRNLSEAKDHDEFKMNIEMLKKIVDRY